MPLFFDSSGQRVEQGASEARKRPSGAFVARCACRGVITPRASLVARSKKEVTTYVVTSFLERATRLARGVITPRHAQRATNAPLGRFLASLAPCSTLCPLESKNKGMTYVMPLLFGAGDEARTRYLHLGKVALYQMSYGRMLESFAQSLSPGDVCYYKLYERKSQAFFTFFCINFYAFSLGTFSAVEGQFLRSAFRSTL